MLHQQVTSKSPTVFHHTDTLRLPWIMAERQLNPTRGMCSADYPRPTFLWANASAAATHSDARKLWRQGGSLLVRFILPADDFTPWSEIRGRYPAWTPEKIARQERNGRKMGSDPAGWMCRVEVLPMQRWLGIETRSYTSTRWRPFDFTAYTAMEASQDNLNLKPVTTVHETVDEVCAAAIEIDDRVYISKRLIPRNGRTMYTAAVSASA